MLTHKVILLLLIDNFDSFTYNLAQYFQSLGVPVSVVRNNCLTVRDCQNLAPAYIVISPGPGNPSQSGISREIISAMAGKVPLFGVCLGHQCIGEVFGGQVVRAKQPMHGKLSRIFHDNQGVFCELPQGFLATRYHSLIVERKSLPQCLKITAETEEGEIMGLRHRDFRGLEGVQFHPESIMTESGLAIIKNFLKHSKEVFYVQT